MDIFPNFPPIPATSTPLDCAHQEACQYNIRSNWAVCGKKCNQAPTTLVAQDPGACGVFCLVGWRLERHEPTGDSGHCFFAGSFLCLWIFLLLVLLLSFFLFFLCVFPLLVFCFGVFFLVVFYLAITAVAFIWLWHFTLFYVYLAVRPTWLRHFFGCDTYLAATVMFGCYTSSAPTFNWRRHIRGCSVMMMVMLMMLLLLCGW